MKPEVTIVIATYNSQKTLPLVLDSIKKQTYPRSRIEILLIDGGSSDSTLALGRKYHCRMKRNPRTEPVYAKYLGYVNAKGKYIMYLDHDEVIENKDDLTRKVQVLGSDERVKMVVGSGYKNPKGYPFINDYVNDFGDPLSLFMDHLSRNSLFFMNTMRRRYRLVSENRTFAIFSFTPEGVLPPFELVQGGSMLNLIYLKKQFPKIIKKYELIPHLFFMLCLKSPYLAVIKNSPLIHYSSETFEKYLKKISWRIKNNIYHVKTMGKTGFAGREGFQPGWRKYKKYFFLPYAFSVIFPLFDSIYLVATRDNFAYLLHIPLCIFTSTLIIYHSLLKFLGKSPQLKNYDESKVIGNK